MGFLSNELIAGASGAPKTHPHSPDAYYPPTVGEGTDRRPSDPLDLDWLLHRHWRRHRLGTKEFDWNVDATIASVLNQVGDTSRPLLVIE